MKTDQQRAYVLLLIGAAVVLAAGISAGLGLLIAPTIDDTRFGRRNNPLRRILDQTASNVVYSERFVVNR